MAKLTACSTLAFSLSSLEQALEHIASYGFRHVEIAEMLTHSKHYPIDTVEPTEVGRLLSKHSLDPIAANVSIASFDDGQSNYVRLPVERQSAAETPEIQSAKLNRVFHRLHVEREAEAYAARVRKLIDKAEVSGIPMVSIQAGRRGQIKNIDGELEAAAGVIDTQAEYARAHHVRILLEMPHVWDLYFDVAKSRQMLSYLRSDNVGVILDATHWHTSGYDLDAYIDYLGDRLWHVHLRDAAGKDSAGGNYELERTPGKGEVDFRLLGETLDRHGYSGHVSLETEYKNYRDPAEVDAENAYAIAHLKNVGWKIQDGS